MGPTLDPFRVPGEGHKVGYNELTHNNQEVPVKGKILFATGLATGYVLGSKAGRQAYERIKSQASDIWESPAVQKTVSQAGTLAKETAGAAQNKVSSALGHATESASSAGEGTSSGSSGGDGSGDSSTTSGTSTGGSV